MGTSSESGRVSPEVLREIVEGTSAETGAEFFDKLVWHLAHATDTMCAWVTEWLPEERVLRALSFWMAGSYVRDFQYEVAGTPCEPVVERLDLVHIANDVIDLIPEGSGLTQLAPVSYLAVPLLDTDGTVLGHLALLDDKVMPEDPQLLAVFRIFAVRAAAELRRLRRDAVLRDREAKLSRLFTSAMDAIVELDGELRITQMNDAARASLGVSDEDMEGEPFDPYADAPSRGKLTYLVAELHRSQQARPSSWVPDGLRLKRRDGSGFQAETTISSYEMGGNTYYTLIFRDIDERLRAEAQIRSLMEEAASLRAEVASFQDRGDIVGRSASLGRVLDDVRKVADTDATILITGETGTGKELIAREVHRLSRRASKPLIKMNCAAIPTGLQESEFFGHEKGAFTGATDRRPGRFKLADGGTLFLDEVGEMPLDLQAKLLRVLQEGEFEPVGSARTESVDVRLIAATNRDLAAMVEEGTFREDLLYRLNVFPIDLPPLRERDDDVILLAERFLEETGRRVGRPGMRLTPGCAAKLRRYTWPGNVRELHNVLERAVITSMDGVHLNLERALPESEPGLAAVPDPTTPQVILTAAEMRDFERANIARALEACGWKISGEGGAAERLGLPANTLSSRMKSLGISRPD